MKFVGLTNSATPPLSKPLGERKAALSTTPSSPLPPQDQVTTGSEAPLILWPAQLKTLPQTSNIATAAALKVSEETALQASAAALGGATAAAPGLWQKLKRFTTEIFSGEYGVRSSARKAVAQTNKLEESFQKLSSSQLKAKTQEFKNRLNEGETLDHLLPEAFAAAREASRRTIGIRPYDVQLEGAFYAQKGGVVEMKTGEGKTFMGMVASYLHALKGDGVHVLTYNDYLAQRDAQKASKVMSALGVKVGSISPDMDPKERKEANQADITYGSAAEFGFQYLRDNLVHNPEDRMSRDPSKVFALLDEADSILLDESRTPLIVSDQVQEDEKPTRIFSEVVKHLKSGADYESKKAEGKAWLTESGTEKVEKILGLGDLYSARNEKYLPYMDAALHVKALLGKDVDYMIKDGQVMLIDQLTGRAKPQHRFSEGIHQAIEAAEGLEIGQSSKTVASITYPNYLRKYATVAGMTGTAVSAQEDFESLGLDVIDVPTHRPNQRNDMEDRLFPTAEARNLALAQEVKESRAKGQPVLLGTPTIELSEKLSKTLSEMGIEHQVLNARNPAAEAEIVAQAGRRGAVTIATNMAGRGTDIKLGGDPEQLARMESQETGVAPELLLGKWKEHCQSEKARVLEAGGLRVLGAGRNESRRIDDQLAGRAGRQGDPGSSQFFLSLDDRLMAKNLDERPELKTEVRGEEAAKWVEKAQYRSEGRNRDARNNLLRFDTVSNLQREAVYASREAVVEGEDVSQQLPSLIGRAAKAITSQHFEGSHQKDPLRSREHASVVARVPLQDVPQFSSAKEMTKWLDARLTQRMEGREKAFGEQAFKETLKTLYLTSTDHGWSLQQDTLKFLREGSWTKGYAQKDPLQEYNLEAHQAFERMQDGVAVRFVQMALQVPTPEEARQQISSGQAKFQSYSE